MNNLRNFDVMGTVAYVATVPFNMERFTFSYGKMMAYNAKKLETDNKYIYYERQRMSWLPRGRNDLVRSLRGDWLFMLDLDLEFDPDVLERMLYIMDKYQAPVVSGLYVQKKKPHFPILYSYNDRRKKYEVVVKWPSNPEIFQIDGAGGGCLLVKKFVFDMIWEKLHEQPFDVIGQSGEDMSFFTRLRKCGIGFYVAPQIRFTHLGVQGVDYKPDELSDRLLYKTTSK